MPACQANSCESCLNLSECALNSLLVYSAQHNDFRQTSLKEHNRCAGVFTAGKVRLKIQYTHILDLRFQIPTRSALSVQ